MAFGPLIPGNPGYQSPSDGGLGDLFSGLLSGFGNFGDTVTNAFNQASSFVNNLGSNIVSNYVAPFVGMAPYQQYVPPQQATHNIQWNAAYNQYQDLTSGGLVTPDFVGAHASQYTVLPGTVSTSNPGFNTYGGAGLPQQFQQQYTPSGGQPVTVNTTVQAPQVTVDLGQGIGQFVGQVLPGIINNIAPALAPLTQQFQTIADGLVQMLGQQQQAFNNNGNDVVSRAVTNIEKSQSDQQDQISSLRNRLNDEIAQGLAVSHSSIESMVKNAYDEMQRTIAQLADTTDHTLGGVSQLSKDVELLAKQQADALAAKGQAQELDFWGTLTQFFKLAFADLQNAGSVSEAIIKKSYDQLVAPISNSVIGQKDKLDSLVANLQNGKYRSMAEFRDALTAIVPAASLVFGAVNLASLLAIIIESVQVGASPAVNALQQQINAEHPTALLPSNELMEAFRRETWTKRDIEDELAKQGFNQDRRGIILDNARHLVDPGTLEESTLRGFIPPEESAARLSQSGYSPEAIKIIQDLYDKIPNPTDLTRIADKRVWGNRVDAKYGQFTEIPDEYRLYMAQWGLDEKFTNWLWAAHWNLPSPQEIFTMFHRNQITQADMEAYLGLTDWLPFFRDKLLSISYNVLGRIDTRRAHNAGIIDDATAIRKYQDAGYTVEDARILLSLTKATNTTDGMSQITKLKARAQTAVEAAYVKGKIDRQNTIQRLQDLGLLPGIAMGITQVLDEEIFQNTPTVKPTDHKQRAATKILSAFGNGSIPEGFAHTLLLELGYSEVDAINELYLVEIDRQSELKKLWVDHAETMYVQHQIDLPDLDAMLTSQGFTESEIGQIEEELTIKRQLRNKKLTEPQILAFHKKGIITDDELLTELVGFGYPDREIGWILKSVGIGG